MKRTQLLLTLLGCVFAVASARADDTADLNAAYDKATKLYNEAKYDEAVPLFQKTLRLCLKVYGENHAETATVLNDLAVLYHDQGKYDAAEPLHLRSLKIRTAVLGKDHLDVAASLNNLGVVYRDQGKFAAAEPLYLRSLRIKEAALGKDHAEVALALNNLALVYHDQAKYAAAEPLYLRSLKITEGAVGKDHPDVAVPLNNLANLYRDQEKYAAAEPLYLRSLKIYEDALGKDHADVALALNNLANLYHTQGKSAAAEPLYERSLKIYETVYGRDHPDVAMPINNLAVVYRDQGKYAKAEPLYLRSLRIKGAALGKHHPDTMLSLDNLIVLYTDQSLFDQAVPRLHELRQASRSFFLRELPSLSAREQHEFLSQTESERFAHALSVGRHLLKNQAVAARSAEWLLNGKAIGVEAQALTTVVERQADPARVARLNDLRAQEAALALGVTTPEERDAVQVQRREVEKAIAQAGGAAARLARPWIDLAAVRAAIPAGGLLIDIARFEPRHFGAKPGELSWDDARYVAWVIPPAGDIAVVDLGEADAIDAAVKEARGVVAKSAKRIKEVGEPKAAAEMAEPLQKLADLVLKPLTPHLANAKSLILSPDGELWLAPWAALPVAKDRFLVEDYPLRYVVTGRDLVVTPPARKLATSAPLVLADPRFGDAAAALDAGRGTLGRLPQVGRLPGTATEAESVLPKLAALTGSAPTVHTDEKATEAAVKAAVRPKVLILATHGFFLPTLDEGLTDDGTRSAASMTKDGQPVENPLLRCGLLLAGCNRRGVLKAGEDDGVLTGLEIVGTDLRGTEMVVLSACETGLGDVKTGEGVAGLRQAFQLAGAASVVATLWQIPDVQSAQLMVGFFDALTRKLPRDEALRAAQLEQIQARRDRFGAAHPFFWAAYTVTGQVK